MPSALSSLDIPLYPGELTASPVMSPVLWQQQLLLEHSISTSEFISNHVFNAEEQSKVEGSWTSISVQSSKEEVVLGRPGASWEGSAQLPGRSGLELGLPVMGHWNWSLQEANGFL